MGDVGKEGRDGVGGGVGDAVEKIGSRVGGPAGEKRTVQSVSQSCSQSCPRAVQCRRDSVSRMGIGPGSVSILYPGCIKGNRKEKEL